ncbi:Chitinase 2 [Microsporum ferrugineum]
MASSKIITAFIAFLSLLTMSAFALDVASSTNLVTYWGQGDNQERLSYFCQQTEHDIIVIGFVNVFPDQGLGGWPGTNFGNQCGNSTYETLDGQKTELLSGCDNIKEDLPICRAAGKTILLSLGGESINGPYTYSVKSRESAVDFADFLWGAFGPPSPGWHGPRPFGDNAVDGFDFDIEVNGGANYQYMVERLRSHFDKDPSRRYYISGAPQCIVPDEQLGDAITNSVFDFIFVQLYSAPECTLYIPSGCPSCGSSDCLSCGSPECLSCGSSESSYYSSSKSSDSSGSGFYIHFDIEGWMEFIRESANPNVKFFIGLTARERIGHLSLDEVEIFIREFINEFEDNFGGAMVWDAQSSEENRSEGRSYAANVKRLLLDHGPSQPTTTSTRPTSTSESTTQASSTFITTTSIWSSGGGIPTISTTPKYPNITSTYIPVETSTTSDVTITLTVTPSMHQSTDTMTPTPSYTTMPMIPASSSHPGDPSTTSVIATSYTTVYATGTTTVTTTTYTTVYYPETGAPTTLTLTYPVTVVGPTVTVIPTPAPSGEPENPTTLTSVALPPSPNVPVPPEGSDTVANPTSTAPSMPVYTGGASLPSFSIAAIALGAVASYAMML